MWKVIDLEYRKSDGVAIKVTVQYMVIQGDVIERDIITIDLDEPNGDITPFEELTEDMVILWVKSKIDYQTIEVSVLERLDERVIELQNKITENDLPWI
jgi:hypothetical protein